MAGYPGLLFVALVLGMTSLCARAAQTSPLTLGIHPYLPATRLIERFTPLAEYLGQRLQRPVHLKIAQNYQEHLSNLTNGEIDLAFFGPTLYLTADRQYGPPRLLARLASEGDIALRGVIIARADSELEALAQLRGKRFAFGDPNSTLSTRVPIALLQRAGVELADLGDYNYLKNHHNVALAVLMGNYDAGGIKEEVFLHYRERGLKALATTPAITTHAFVAGYRLDDETVAVLREALLGLHLAPHGAQTLARIRKGATQLIPVTGDDYDALRQILYQGSIQ